MRLFELKKGQTFEFDFPALPAGRLTVFSCWGVMSRKNVPLDPWFIVCHDETRACHCLVLPALTELKAMTGFKAPTRVEAISAGSREMPREATQPS
jgi:hypothetical protein